MKTNYIEKYIDYLFCIKQRTLILLFQYIILFYVYFIFQVIISCYSW